jgi:hypothetical protein
MLVNRPRRRRGSGEDFIGCLFLLGIVAVIVVAGNSVYRHFFPSLPARPEPPPVPDARFSARLERMDPEEAGSWLFYADLYGKMAVDANNYWVADAESRLYKIAKRHDKLRSSDGDRAKAFSELTGTAAKWLPRLKRVFPAKSMTDFHWKMVKIMECSQAPAVPAENLGRLCSDYCASYTAFEDTVDARKAAPAPPVRWEVCFQPVDVPAKVNIFTGDVSFEIAFETPAGDFTVAPIEFRHEYLCIRYGECERRLRFKKPFKLAFKRGYEIREIGNMPGEPYFLIEFYPPN